jgi:hypothetical protein
MDIPFRTIQGWRKPTYVSRYPDLLREDCPRCHGAGLDGSNYVYLLGMYLGDGMLVECPRVHRLEIALDSRYPGIIQECHAAISALRDPRLMTIGTQSYPTWKVMYAYWKHWPCLFPQHGPGRKHDRRIELEDWQRGLATVHPHRLLRGLIHSDGWRGTNTVRNKLGRTYSYPRYLFTNVSADIRSLFCQACDTYGVEWRRSRWNAIAISRGRDVARLDEVVGPKW